MIPKSWATVGFGVSAHEYDIFKVFLPLSSIVK